jgi:hypothetical protein
MVEIETEVEVLRSIDNPWKYLNPNPKQQRHQLKMALNKSRLALCICLNMLGNNVPMAQILCRPSICLHVIRRSKDETRGACGRSLRPPVGHLKEVEDSCKSTEQSRIRPQKVRLTHSLFWIRINLCKGELNSTERQEARILARPRIILATATRLQLCPAQRNICGLGLPP